MRKIACLMKRLGVDLGYRGTTESASNINRICTASSEREQWKRGPFWRDREIRRRGLEPKAQARFPPMGPGRVRSVNRRSTRRPCQPRHPSVLAPARVGTIYGPERCRSSVVEHSLGKGEVVGSIPTGSTSHPADFAGFSTGPRSPIGDRAPLRMTEHAVNGRGIAGEFVRSSSQDWHGGDTVPNR